MRCTCDDIGEGACPVHAAENKAQDERIAKENAERAKPIPGLTIGRVVRYRDEGTDRVAIVLCVFDAVEGDVGLRVLVPGAMLARSEWKYADLPAAGCAKDFEVRCSFSEEPGEGLWSWPARA